MKLQQWTQQIDGNTAAFKQYFGGLTAESLNWKPSPGAWSIAQNIDHLITINQSYFKIIEDIRQGGYQLPLMGKFGFVVALFGNMLYNASKPDRKKKISTFDIWQPTTSPAGEEILQRFETHQEELKAIIKSSMDLIAENVVISSPANKNIVYKLEKAFDIIIVHEQRHLEQSKEVLSMMKTNGVSTVV